MYSQGKDIFLCNCPESLLKEGKGSPRSDNVELVCVQVSLYATGGGVKRFVIEKFRLSGIAEQIRSLSSGKEAVKR